MNAGPNRVLDEFAKLMTDAAGVAQGVRREAETAFRSQAERFLNQMDLVQREEFDVVRDMAIKAREENDALREEIETLKTLVSELKKPVKRTTRAATSKKSDSN
ncbi:MAG: accessory factor UbiK family protein [Pseudomonadota bacterium]